MLNAYLEVLFKFGYCIFGYCFFGIKLEKVERSLVIYHRGNSCGGGVVFDKLDICLFLDGAFRNLEFNLFTG